MDVSDDADRLQTLLYSSYSADVVRQLERPLLDDGVPLMRMAASAVARVTLSLLDDEDLDVEDARVTVLAGAGDNGGDGLYAGAELAREGAQVTAVAVGRSLHEDAFRAFVRAGGRVLVLDPAADISGCTSGFSAGEAGERLQAAVECARGAHVVLDAMTGIGVVGALRGVAGTLASSLGMDGVLPDKPALPNNDPSADLPLVVAVDAPSGVGVDDGSLPGPYIPADVTVTFGAMKPCAMVPPASYACGRITLVDFGFDVDDAVPFAEMTDGDFVADSVRLPSLADGKYSRGVVGLVTGSARYPGAAVLSGEGRGVRECGHGALSGATACAGYDNCPCCRRLCWARAGCSRGWLDPACPPRVTLLPVMTCNVRPLPRCWIITRWRMAMARGTSGRRACLPLWLMPARWICCRAMLCRRSLSLRMPANWPHC